MKLSGQQQQVVDYIAGAMLIDSCYAPSALLRRTVYALQKKGLISFEEWKGGHRYELTDKGKTHAKWPYAINVGYVIASSELTALKMSAGNEKLYPRVIEGDEVKLWVGVGWVSEGAPTAIQDSNLPHVIDKTWISGRYLK